MPITTFIPYQTMKRVSRSAAGSMSRSVKRRRAVAMPQDRGGVGDRFLVPELGSGRVEVGHVRVLVVGGDLERRTGPGRGTTLPAAMPGAWPCTTGITLSPMSATRRPTRTRSRNRGPPEHAAALAEIPLPLPGANPGADGLGNGSRTADARTSGCRADQLADRSRTTLKATRVPPDHKAFARPRVPVAGRGDPHNPAGTVAGIGWPRDHLAAGLGRRTPAVTERRGPQMRASHVDPPYCAAAVPSRLRAARCRAGCSGAERRVGPDLLCPDGRGR
jgi:hypothetical protein